MKEFNLAFRKIFDFPLDAYFPFEKKLDLFIPPLKISKR